MNNKNKKGIIPNDVINVKAKIKEFEVTNNVVFPEEYKKFLLKYNGGKTNKVTFIKAGWKSDFYGDKVCIEDFYSIEKICVAYQEKKDEQKYDFQNIEQIRNLVPIARASGDYSILMSLDQEEQGYIYLQDDRNRQSFSIALITESFRELLLNLEKEKVIVGNLLQKRMLKSAKTEEEKKRIDALFEKESKRNQQENYLDLEV